ncbi:hypothetical protein K490DRAFT_54720 [Saccharata proteae CBS 121410]|uniref:EGF-like domain-containing protein n=1 Tax=Saccharata proteae CBS 121410 TaxID=1314787 RepID=A0A9P4LYH2_9PEZI|nr:hypothetical protein K490DRAFT_54720 [Saccharata proteae CBS 121410]
MSYDPRGAGVPYGTTADSSRHGKPGRKGSVKAARQRVQEEQARMGHDTFATPYYGSHAASPGRPGRANELVSQFNTRHRPPVQQLQLQIPTPPSSRGSSRHQQRSPEQHWPLNEGHDEGSPRQRTNDRSSPPQRPPRPSYVPSILDPTVQQNMLHAPQRPGQPPMPAPSDQPSPQRYRNDDFLSPNIYVPSPKPNRPTTTSSYASNSSIGSIPDFPIASMPAQQPRKSPNIGPPPSARRGPSSYYSQASYVSPIVEEAESNRSHNSFASSNVMPTHAEEYYSDDDDGTDVLDLSPTTDDGDERASRKSDEADSAGLVRKASFGRRGKPSLTTIRSVETLNSRKNSLVGQAAVAAGAAGGAFAAGLGNSNHKDGQARSSSRPDSEALAGGTGLFGPSTSSSSNNSSQESLSVFGKSKKNKVPSPLGRQSASMPPNGPEVDRVLNGLEKGGMFASAKPIQQGNLADRVGARRPPRLDMDSVRDAEARGSLTSLPDLIKRATRLAGNLDRGKTASKLGLDFWEKGGQDEKQQWGHQRKSGSLSDILSSFPPPAVGTPTGGHTPHDRPISRWPSGLAMEHHYEDDHYPQKRTGRPKKQGRRCCGMPLWCFVTLITMLAVLAIAAVVVPVCLIVLPAKSNSSSSSASAKALAACQSSQACQNGGTSLVSPSGSCSCLCTNGFTGDTCTTESDPSCTTTTVGSTSNATIGSSIPLLFQSATNYSIPLDPPTLLSLFSSNNLSCTSENALVTFNGLSSRSLKQLHPVPPPPSSTLDLNLNPDLAPRAAQTSAGIIFDSISASTSTSPSPITTTTTTSPTTSSPASPTYSTTPTNPTTTTTQLLFARLAVLFILQQTAALDAAVAAQESLQTWFSGDLAGRNGTEVALGQGFTADMALSQILAANGTTFGGIV